MPEYGWVTDDMFDDKLLEIMQDDGIGSVLSIPGVYEAVREYYNNDVLSALEKEREQNSEEGDDEY